MRHVQRALVLGLAVDAKALDHGEHFSRGFAKHLVQAAALLLAEGGLDVIRADPGTGVDQPDVAPGAAVADLPGLQQDHRLALFEQVDGRRQAGNAATDHADIGLVLTGQGLGGHARFADEFPQAFLTQFGHGPAPAICSCWGRSAAHRRQASSHRDRCHLHDPCGSWLAGETGAKPPPADISRTRYPAPAAARASSSRYWSGDACSLSRHPSPTHGHRRFPSRHQTHRQSRRRWYRC
ncbi:hypothetical protein D9M71_436890 [compost metagenome]